MKVEDAIEKIPKELRWLVICTPLPFIIAATLDFKQKMKNMTDWDSSNHFRCLHYKGSSWCKEMNSRIWENDPCSGYQSSASTIQDST